MYGYLCVTVIEGGEVTNREAGFMYADESFSSNVL